MTTGGGGASSVRHGPVIRELMRAKRTTQDASAAVASGAVMRLSIDDDANAIEWPAGR